MSQKIVSEGALAPERGSRESLMKALILGRTNVGKSSLFNRLAGKRLALVFDESGITRDVLKSRARWWGHEFLVMDSGGLPDISRKDELSLKIKGKINEALSEADVLIVVADGRAGPHPEDALALEMARKSGRPFLFFVNKADDPKKAPLLEADFFRLSGELLSGSFEKNYGVDEIVEWLIAQKKKLSGLAGTAEKPAIETGAALWESLPLRRGLGAADRPPIETGAARQPGAPSPHRAFCHRQGQQRQKPALQPDFKPKPH